MQQTLAMEAAREKERRPFSGNFSGAEFGALFRAAGIFGAQFGALFRTLGILATWFRALFPAGNNYFFV